MSKSKLAGPLFLGLLGIFLALNALDNPGLAGVSGPDIIKLISVGLAFGVAFGLLVADRMNGRDEAQS